MKRRTRMYEPWGYQDQNDYQGAGVILENDLDSFFAEVSYNKDDNKIHFANKDGEEKATLDVNEFVKSQVIVEKAWYENGNIHIKFTNGDEIVVDVKELLDENEFKDGLQVVEGQVSVLINTAESDEYISVGEAGIKLFGVKRDIEAEEARAISAETALDEKIDAEIERATGAEQTLDEKIDAEIARATAEETRIDTKLDQEIARATAEEAAANRRIDSLNDELDAEKTIRESADAALGRRIDKEIDDRTADVDEEEARAIAAEEALDAKIDQEIVNREADVDAEETRAKAVEEALDEKIDAEIARATSADTRLQGDIDTETTARIEKDTELNGLIEAEVARATGKETEIDGKIDTEIAERKAEAVATAEYVKSDNKIYFKNANNDAISEVDTTDFVVDGMVEDVKIENGNLVITFNTDAGKQNIAIPLTEIFDPSNYYNKAEIDAKETALQTGISANTAAIAAEETRATEVESGILDLIEAETDRATSAETDLQAAIELKADKETTYTQEEVDALIKAKETEIYNLTKLVGEIGGNVTYDYPNELGTSLTSLLNNSGTVKLGEDATISRFGPGITAKNKVKLNLNNHNLTSTSAGSYGAIMGRGTQEITIGGKGTIEAGDGICIEANGAGCTINLTGSTTVYQNDRSGGELIYCYAGTINITNGTFKNNGADKKYMLNCYDANYQNGTAKIIVTGGKFYDFDPGNNEAEGPNTSFLAEGYHSEASTVIEEGVEHTVYTVKKDA